MRTRLSSSIYSTLLAVLLTSTAGISASTSESDSVHFHEPFDYEEWRREHPLPAAKRPANLNVGEPRTVRMIYFSPSDRPFRAEVVQDMKDRIREVQTFYAASMDERGYDDTTFQFETDGTGEPLVHRVSARHPDSHYLNQTFVKVLNEIEQAFDTEQNVYLVVIDISTDVIDRAAGGIATRIGKIGGFALVTSDEMDPWNYHNVVSHELGHTFGLGHDFRHNEYVMSYGNLPDSRLSMCNAGFLAAHPYFDANSPSESGHPPSIELISPLTYPAGSTNVAVKLEVNDPDGLHQVILHVPNSVKACSVLAGERDAVVTFDYDGVIPGDWVRFSSLSEPSVHPLAVEAVDRDGNGERTRFEISELPNDVVRTTPHRLEKIDGANQRGTPGTPLERRFTVEVRDRNDNPLPDVQVAFAVAMGGGRLSGRFRLEHAVTDMNGHAGRRLTLGPRPGTNTVTVSVSGLEPVTFQAMGVGTGISLPATKGDFRTWHLPDDAIARLGKGRLSLGDRAVSFSPDGHRLAAARNIGIWTYDLATLQPAGLMPAEHLIESMAFSPDGAMIAWSERVYFDTNIKVWDTTTNTPVAGLSFLGDWGGWGRWPQGVAFSPDGGLLACVSSDNSIVMWDTGTWQRVATYEGKPSRAVLDYNPLAFSPDGRLLAAADNNHHTISLWDVAAHEKAGTLTGHKFFVRSISFSPDGQTIASGSFDRTVRLWDAATHTNLATLYGHTDDVRSVSYSPDGSTVASASSDGTIRLWDAGSHESVATLYGQTGEVRSVSFSTDGNTLVSASFDGRVDLWDVQARGIVDRIEKESATTSVAFSPLGGIFASGSDDRTITLWDVETHEKVASLEGHASGVTSLAFLRNGTLVSGAFEEIRVWDLAMGTYVAVARHFRGGCVINTLVVSPDGATVASGGRDELVLWDVATGAQSAVSVNAPLVSYAPDGSVLATKSVDGFIQLWDAATLENLNTVYQGFLGVGGNLGFLAFSPDGTTIASGTEKGPRIDSVVLLYDVATGERVATLEKPNGSQLFSGAFSPDGRILAAGSHKGTVVLWNMETLEEIATFYGHRHDVRSVSYSPDGRMLGSASDDGTMLLWDLTPYIVRPTSIADFDGDGTVGFPDFLLFVGAYGLSRGDAGYDERFDLDGNGTIGFSDLLILAESFGQGG